MKEPTAALKVPPRVQRFVCRGFLLARLGNHRPGRRRGGLTPAGPRSTSDPKFFFSAMVDCQDIRPPCDDRSGDAA
jgi:hypothetical protein